MALIFPDFLVAITITSIAAIFCKTLDRGFILQLYEFELTFAKADIKGNRDHHQL